MCRPLTRSWPPSCTALRCLRLRIRRCSLFWTGWPNLAGGLDDVRTRTAGELAGGWFAAPGRHIGHELIAAGLLILSGVVDRDQLEEAVRAGYERGSDALRGYDPTDATS